MIYLSGVGLRIHDYEEQAPWVNRDGEKHSTVMDIIAAGELGTQIDGSFLFAVVGFSQANQEHYIDLQADHGGS